MTTTTPAENRAKPSVTKRSSSKNKPAKKKKSERQVTTIAETEFMRSLRNRGLRWQARLEARGPDRALPWLIAVWLGAGAGISWWVRANLRWHGRKEKKRPVTQQNLMMIVLCALSAFVIVKNDVLPNAQIAAWKPRSSMRTLAATTIDECVNERSRTVIYTFGEPALLYHLNASGVLTRPVSSIPKSAPSAGGEPYDVLLIEGPHARRTEAFDTMSAELARLYERAGSYDILPSDLVLLNDREAAKMTGTNARETETFHVWRLKTGAND